MDSYKITGPQDGCWGEEHAHGLTLEEAEAGADHLRSEWPGVEFSVEQEEN